MVMLQALLRPEELTRLRDRDVAVLSAVIKRELISNPTINQELAAKIEPLARELRTRTDT